MANEIVNSSPEKSKGFTGDEYNAVALSAKLTAVSLLSSRFDVKPDILGAGDSADLKLSYGRTLMACQFDRELGQVAALFQYHVTGKSGRRKVLSCVVDYLVSYEIALDAAELAALGFCRNTGSFAAYPYFRALVAQFAWGAGLNLPPLPAIASTAHIQKQVQSDDAKQINN